MHAGHHEYCATDTPPSRLKHQISHPSLAQPFSPSGNRNTGYSSSARLAAGILLCCRGRTTACIPLLHPGNIAGERVWVAMFQHALLAFQRLAEKGLGRSVAALGSDAGGQLVDAAQCFGVVRSHHRCTQI